MSDGTPHYSVEQLHWVLTPPPSSNPQVCVSQLGVMWRHSSGQVTVWQRSWWLQPLRSRSRYAATLTSRINVMSSHMRLWRATELCDGGQLWPRLERRSPLVMGSHRTVSWSAWVIDWHLLITWRQKTPVLSVLWAQTFLCSSSAFASFLLKLNQLAASL